MMPVRVVIVIALLVVATLAPCKSSSGNEPTTKSVKSHVEVLILGAGIAGLSAARKLKESGVTDFAVLEGLKRVGGRLRNAKVANVTVELGANWVHGINGNAIWRMAQECNLTGVLSDFDNVTMRWSSRDSALHREHDSDRRHRRQQQEQERSDSAAATTFTSRLDEQGNDKLLVAHCYTCEGDKTCAGDSGASVLERWKTLELTEEMVKRQRREMDADGGGGGAPDDYSLRAAMRMEGWRPQDHADHAIEYFNYDFEYARSPDETSFVGSLLHVYEDFDSENFFVADQRGFATVVQKTCEGVFGACVPLADDEEASGGLGDGDGPWLLLGKNVTAVSSSCRRRWREAGLEGGGERDSELPPWNATDARYCVETADGAALTANQIILTFPLGVLQHNLVEFSPPLPKWKVKALHRMDIGLFSKVFVAFPHRFWDASQFLIYVSSRRRFMVPWINLDYAMPAAAGEATGSPSILAVVLTGEEASRVEEQPMAVTKAEVMDTLRDMFPDQDIPEPLDIIKSDWDVHPFFRGSYSNRPIGLTANDLHNIRAPVGRLFFAGEATSKRYNGFLQGGLESGLSAAADVLSHLGLVGDTCEIVQPKPHHDMEQNTASNSKGAVQCSCDSCPGGNQFGQAHESPRVRGHPFNALLPNAVERRPTCEVCKELKCQQADVVCTREMCRDVVSQSLPSDCQHAWPMHLERLLLLLTSVCVVTVVLCVLKDFCLGKYNSIVNS